MRNGKPFRYEGRARGQGATLLIARRLRAGPPRGLGVGLGGGGMRAALELNWVGSQGVSNEGHQGVRY